MICNKCNAVLPDDSVFCPECGSKLTTPKVIKTPKIKRERTLIIDKTPVICLCILTVAFLLYHIVFGAWWYDNISDVVLTIVILIALVVIVLAWRKLWNWLFAGDTGENITIRKIITIAIFVGASLLGSMVTGGAQYAGYEFIAYPLPIAFFSLIVAIVGIVLLKVSTK